MNGLKKENMELKKWVCLEDCKANFDDTLILFKKGKTYNQVHPSWLGSVDERGDNRGFGKLEKHFKEIH